jgi:hypothetical protein
MSVPCPKCKGGCSLCLGVGAVNETVARLYIREETRPTIKMRPGQQSTFLADEVPTRPDLIRQIQRRQRIGLAFVIVIIILVTVIVLLVVSSK